LEKASAIIADSLILGKRCTINCFRLEIKAAAREFARVLKQIAGVGYRQMVVNEDTVRPRCRFPVGVSYAVVTNTTMD